MNKLRQKIKQKPHLILSVPAVLCFITFITNFIAALSDGKIDNTELHTLLSSADGFEAVLLVIIMYVMKDKKH